MTRRPRSTLRPDPVSSKPASTTPWRDFVTFTGVVATICGSVVVAVAPIREPVSFVASPVASPHGYTISLVLFAGPIAMLLWWFYRHPEIRIARRAFWWTVATLAPLGFGLDFLLAETLFDFGSPESTLRWQIPVVGGSAPIEEFVFYFLGFVAVLLTYVWADEHWLSLYNVPDYEEAATHVGSLLQFDWRALPAGAALIVLATLWGWTGGDDRPPLYFYFLTVAALLPTLGLLRTTIHFINWRAFGFTFFAIVFVSLLWEVTLAMPYGWWAYHEEWMLGTIRPWWDLPVEAVLVWLVVTYTSVVWFEAMKIWLASGRRPASVWFAR